MLPAEVEGAHLSANAILQALGNQGLTRVFCEGGGALAASLLAADLVDELVTFTAGMIMGAEGYPAIGAMGLEQLSDAPRFVMSDQQVAGDDMMCVWRKA